MTKKDYILLAEAIRLNTDSQEKDYLHKGTFLMHLLPKLKEDNPAFDCQKFIKACGEC